MITDESARFDLGRVNRDIDVPTPALEFLRDGGHEDFRFRASGEEDIEGTRTVRLSYEERGHLTVIRDSLGRDVPASAQL